MNLNKTEFETVKNFFDVSDFISEKIVYGGSARVYHRILINNKSSYILCSYKDSDEFSRFLKITEILNKRGINVPEILFFNTESRIMIQQDIGTYPFYKYLKENTPENNKEKYFEIIRHLIRMQNCASEDFRKIFPQRKFDKNIYLWETAYFREMVLDRYLETDYDCSQLNSDFEKIALYLDECDEYFMHRDFQSTNIFIHNNKIYFIDYQTAFYGNNLYDAASLIYDPYTEIDFREELTEYYKKNFYKNFTEKNFENKMLYTKAQRLMQACAAYVKLGLIDDKKFFVKFIDKTLNELYYLFNDKNFDKIYLKKISENFIKKNGEKICAE